jgi:hypothetical protein
MAFLYATRTGREMIPTTSVFNAGDVKSMKKKKKKKEPNTYALLVCC